MTMTCKSLSSLLSALAMLLIPVRVSAISPVLCEPRIGDRLDVEILSGMDTFADSAGLCPVMTDARYIGHQTLAVWAPLPDDTVSFAYLSMGPELSRLSRAGGALNVRFEQHPGNRRSFGTGMPYGMAETGFSAPLTSTGTLDGMSRYRTAGQVDTRVHPDLFIITPEGDTLSNAVCVEYSVSDTLFYERGDTCLHTAVQRRWYAPGYRYPLLSGRRDMIRSLENELIDTSEKWYAAGTSAQEEKITRDPLNEEIRLIAAESRLPEPQPVRTAPETTGRHGALPPFLLRDADGFVVSGTSGSGKITSVILCDIKGRVYDSHTFGDTEGRYRIGLSRLISGEVYILYVQSDSESYVYRFKA